MTQAAPTRILSDATLARRAAGGNQRAFTEIFERYHQDLYRYCVAVLGNAEDANDAVQNTMVKVLRALPGEKRELKLKPWLYRIAHNEAIDMIRARRGADPIDAETLAARGGPAEEVEARGRLQQLISDIAELPSRQRGALVMREMSGLSYGQIGEALQTSPAVARQTIYEARLGLRQMSEGREMPCQEVMRALSDDDGRVLRRRDIRAHLRRCDGCQAFRTEISDRRNEFALLAPLPATASAAILQGTLGSAGGGTSVGGAAGAGAVGGAGKAVVGSAAIKSAAAVLAISTVGVVAADRSGVVDLGAGSHPKPPAKSTPASAQPNQPGAQPSAGGVPAAAVGAFRRAAPTRGQGRRDLGRASALGAANPQPAAPSSPGLPTEQAAQSNGGRDESKGSGNDKGIGKNSHPGKGTKSTGATPPGHSKSAGKAKHAGGGEAGGESHPPHPEHPAGSAKSEAPTTPPEAEPPAAPEAAGGEPDKHAAE